MINKTEDKIFKIRNGCLINVKHNDIEKVLPILKKSLELSGVFKALKLRSKYPVINERKRAKRLTRKYLLEKKLKRRAMERENWKRKQRGAVKMSGKSSLK